jgi:hypothetical protein
MYEVKVLVRSAGAQLEEASGVVTFEWALGPQAMLDLNGTWRYTSAGGARDTAH